MLEANKKYTIVIYKRLDSLFGESTIDRVQNNFLPQYHDELSDILLNFRPSSRAQDFHIELKLMLSCRNNRLCQMSKYELGERKRKW